MAASLARVIGEVAADLAFIGFGVPRRRWLVLPNPRLERVTDGRIVLRGA